MSSEVNHEAVVENGKVVLYNEGDTFYQQTFSSWDQIENFVSYLRGKAKEAFGSNTAECDE